MLVQEDVDWLISRWPPPEMSVWRSMLASGSSLFGIFEGQALIGFSIYRPDLSPDTAQLAALYVSNPYRRRKAGGMLLDKVAETARTDGAKRLYVSATPTKNTVDFYVSRGFQLTEDVNQGLYQLEQIGRAHV